MIGYSGRVREPLAYVAKVQSQWEKRVLKSLNSMCMELGQSLAKPRCQNEQQELLSKFLQICIDEEISQTSSHFSSLERSV